MGAIGSFVARPVFRSRPGHLAVPDARAGLPAVPGVAHAPLPACAPGVPLSGWADLGGRSTAPQAMHPPRRGAGTARAVRISPSRGPAT